MIKINIHIIVLFLMAFNVFGQDDPKVLSVDKSNMKEDKVAIRDEYSSLFSYNIHKNIDKFITESNIAYKNKDLDVAKSLLDSLVINHLKGTRFDDFSFKRAFKKKPLVLSEIKKPIFLITYSSWCITSVGEIPALNELSEKYKDNVQIIVVFWDRLESMKDLAKKFSKNIEVCYAHDTYNDDNYLISTLKHTLGFPTAYLIDQKRDLVDIKRSGIITNFKQKYSTEEYLEILNQNIQKFQVSIDELMKTDTVSYQKKTVF